MSSKINIIENNKSYFKDNFLARYNNLNTEQKSAVDQIDGAVLVVAGPGSGKTEILSLRAANILQKTDVLPSSILLLTFTEAASANMRERLVNLIGEEGYRVSIFTFHAFASLLIEQNREYFFEGNVFRPSSDIERLEIVENIIKNMDKTNPLGSYHPEKGFVYTKNIISSISDLKKEGYAPSSFKEKLLENKNILNKISKSKIIESLENVANKSKYEMLIPTYSKIFQDLKNLQSENDQENNAANSYLKILINTLELSLKIAIENGSGKALTEWKTSYTEKEDGIFILKDASEKRQKKLLALADTYKEYKQETFNKGLYDFDDMILLVAEALKTNANLLANIQEKYQYIMIDEFQDTNAAQFDIVKSLTLDIENPNILAVGDDDQAIYKFQGAEMSNIFEFINIYKNSKKIVLDKNYRSTQQVLDFSRNIITQAVDRLEMRDSSFIKNLKSENATLQNLGENKIIEKEFDNEILEHDFIANEIKSLLEKAGEKKVQPKEVVVICRKHNNLRKIAAVFDIAKIPYSYEKRENVLEIKSIKEIISILKFIAHSFNGENVEYLLPEILSFDFWNISRLEIWKIAEKVKQSRVEEKISWVTTMLQSENEDIKNIAEFLIELSVKASSTPLNYIIDKIVQNTYFKNYYFGLDIFKNKKSEYLNFISSLRSLTNALAEFKQGEYLFAKDILDFVEVYNGNNLTLSNKSIFESSNNAVQILTAHKAKGLEFEYVFILDASEKTWNKSGGMKLISFPLNLKLSAEDENDDDKIRLLYVALTRAKHTIYLTHSDKKLSYLLQEKNDKKEEREEGTEKKEISDSVLESLSFGKVPEYVEDEKALLQRVLENYKIPVSHLKSFLDFIKMGPNTFVEQNLLKFPSAMPPAAGYGSAMHAAIEKYFVCINKNKEYPVDGFVFEVFKKELLKYRLPEVEYKKYEKFGIENLQIYIKDLQSRLENSKTEIKVEVKFGGENIMLGAVPITGNIDKIEIQENKIVVSDLKTGNAISSWEEGSSKLLEYEKIKLHFFKYQLAFYKILLKNSKDYNNSKVETGIIEFLEADRSGKIVSLELNLEDELLDRVQRLTEKVYAKVMSLDFPDTSGYKESLVGIIEFEEDLLSGKI